MPDYNLDHLSPRSFEHLVQSLALKYFGRNVTIFGDGKDGGRDATFDGRVSYPSSDSPWNGYGIIQAKFRQRTHDDESGAQWLQDQLQREMSRFTRQKSAGILQRFFESDSKRRLPKYYLIATNVILTPGTGQGKDRITDLMRGWQEQSGWEAFDIWDADKIHRMLDDSPDIRNAYAGWITSGDVLAAVMERLAMSRADCHTVMTRFMHNELLAAQYARLRQAGHTIEQRIPLSRLFVDLPVSTSQRFEEPGDREKQQTNPLFLAQLLRQGDIRLAAFSERYSREISGEARTTRPGRVVLLGGPGQGKTTLGQFACQIYRAALLRDSGVLQPVEVRDALEALQKQSDIVVAAPQCRRYPIHIDLKDLASYLEAHAPAKRPEPDRSAASLAGYVVYLIAQRAGASLTTDDMRLWLESYPWFVFLDGLDEVPATRNRAQVIQCVTEFGLEVQASDADVLILVTCRPQSYTKELDERYYEHWWLTPLLPEQALYYGKLLSRSQHPKESAEGRTVEARLESCVTSPTTARLMCSPLQVTIMAALVEQHGTPPEQRWNLFCEYYRVIYEREMHRETVWSVVLRQHRPDVDAIHRRIGFMLQQQSERQASGEATLSLGQFLDVAWERLAREGHSGEALDHLGGILCEAVRDRLVFLAGLTDERVGYEIQSLQEFMAADYLLDAPGSSSENHDRDVKQNLARIAESPYWRNVVLFAAGRIYSREQHNRDFIEVHCHRMNERTDDPALVATLAGSRLALDLLEDGSAGRQPHNSRVLTRLALRLVRCATTATELRLSSQYSAITSPVFHDEIDRSLQSPRYSEARSASRLMWILARRGSEWAARRLSEIAETPAFSTDAILEWMQEPWAACGRLLRLLSRRLPYLSFTQYQRLRQSAGSDSGSSERFVLGEATVQWWEGWRQKMERRESPDGVARFCISGHHGSDIRFVFQSINFDHAVFTDVTVAPAQDWHIDWRVMTANVRFARRPSKDVLADVLSWLGPDVLKRELRTLQLCWPVEQCVSMCESAADLSAVLDSARAGDFGDTRQWLAAEARWKERGVYGADLVPPRASGKGVFGTQRKSRIFPLEVAEVSLDGPVRPETLYSLIAVAAKAGEPGRRSVSDLVARLTMHVDASDVRAVSRLFDLIVRHDMHIDSRACLRLILASWGLEKLSVFEAVGRRSCLTREPDFPVRREGPSAFEVDVFRRLAGAFIAKPELTGILVLLAHADPVLKTVPIPPGLLQSDGHDERDDIACARVVLRLDQLQWGMGDIEELSAMVAGHRNDRPDLIDRVCRVVLGANGTTAEREALLCALLEQLSDEAANCASRAQLVETLDSLRRRRPSPFELSTVHECTATSARGP